MKKVIIDRKTWRRGLTHVESRLYFRTGNKEERCCVGFDLEQTCGFTSAQLSDLGTALRVVEYNKSDMSSNPVPGLVRWSVIGEHYQNTDVAYALYYANDLPLNAFNPYSVRDEYPFIPEKYRKDGKIFITSEQDREELIAYLFKTIGREVEFIN